MAPTLRVGGFAVKGCANAECSHKAARYGDPVFEVHDVTGWAVDEVDEQLGTKEKRWLISPTEDRWLFKQVRGAESSQRGEDWAEKIVEQLGLHLGLPVAEVELASSREQRGVISKSFVPPNARLEHGNELLVRVDPDYDRDQDRRNERYTLAAVKQALGDASVPAAYLVEGLSAFDLWAGYLVLDAWVGGRDRHHENWAVVAHPQRRVLAPSFDHGNALGFQEPEHRHQSLGRDEAALNRWAERGRSHHFAGAPGLVHLAHDALDQAATDTRSLWMNRLASVGENDIVGIVENVPTGLMSEAARTFCTKLLLLNQRRLCDVC